MSFYSVDYFEKKSHAVLGGIFLMGILIAIDQIIKVFVLQSKTIVHLCNHGIAMGIMLSQQVFIVMWGLLILCVVYFWWQHITKSYWMQLPYILILAGGLSNIVDRFYYGCVIDYIPFLNISSFNIADTFITVGAVIILWQNFIDNEELRIKN